MKFGNIFEHINVAEIGVQEAESVYNRDPNDDTLAALNQAMANLNHALRLEEDF